MVVTKEKELLVFIDKQLDSLQNVIEKAKEKTGYNEMDLKPSTIYKETVEVSKTQKVDGTLKTLAILLRIQGELKKLKYDLTYFITSKEYNKNLVSSCTNKNTLIDFKYDDTQKENVKSQSSFEIFKSEIKKSLECITEEQRIILSTMEELPIKLQRYILKFSEYLHFSDEKSNPEIYGDIQFIITTLHDLFKVLTEYMDNRNIPDYSSCKHSSYEEVINLLGKNKVDKFEKMQYLYVLKEELDNTLKEIGSERKVEKIVKVLKNISLLFNKGLGLVKYYLSTDILEEEVKHSEIVNAGISTRMSLDTLHNLIELELKLNYGSYSDYDKKLLKASSGLLTIKPKGNPITEIYHSYSGNTYMYIENRMTTTLEYIRHYLNVIELLQDRNKGYDDNLESIIDITKKELLNYKEKIETF